MVIKTDTCSFSEFRIYPGHGTRFVRKDGTLLHLINSKCKNLTLQRKKPAKLTWTQAWRRANKKIKVEEVTRKRTKRTVKYQRSIVGATLDEIRAKRATVPKRAPAQAAGDKEKQPVATTAAKKDVKAHKTEMRKNIPVVRQKGASKPMRSGALR